jgi:hypothetical protein
VGVVLELPAPGMENAGKAREVRTDKALVFGEAFDGLRGCLEQGRIGSALMRADKGSEGFGDGEGDEKVRPGKLFVELFVEPVLSFMILTLGAVAIAAGVVDAVLPATALAVIEAVSIVSALAVLNGTNGLVVGERQMGIALEVLWRVGLADVADGGHEASPCMRALMRA